jgi:hypothetical protein
MTAASASKPLCLKQGLQQLPVPVADLPRVTTTIDRATRATELPVCLINEDLGS